MKPFIFSLCVWLSSIVVGSSIICISSVPRPILSDFEYFTFACLFSFKYSIPSFVSFALLSHYLLKASLNSLKIKVLLTLFSAVLVVVTLYLYAGAFNFRTYISYYLPTLIGLWGFKLEASKS